MIVASSCAAAGLAGAVVATADSGVPDQVDPHGQSALIQARANEVFESFSGTQYQRNASGVIQAWSLNGAMDTCMAEQGHPEWDWSTIRNLAPRTDALSTSNWFDDPVGGGYSTAMLDIAPGIRAEYLARTTSPPKDQSAAVDLCIERTPTTSDDAADVESIPAGLAGLRDEWWSMVEDFDAEHGDTDGYNSCFAQVVEKPGFTGDTWEVILQQSLPAATQLPDHAGAEPSKEWTAFLELEEFLEAADWRCRGEVYNDHIEDVLDAVNDFADRNADEIAAIQEGWEAVVEHAEDLGFTGAPGSLDADG